jgi:SAM-dependent methyltransferase
VRPDEIVQRFPGDDYAGFHSRRYALVLERLTEHAPRATTILDVGPSKLTTLVAELYGRAVDTVGFEDVGANNSGGKHYEFDLNRLPADAGPAALGRYDLVLCCEVLEHLLVAPQHLLAWLGEHVADDGVLVLQTPNAAALDRRVKLLLGRQPYDALDPDRTGARHVRECTYAELYAYARTAGFDVASATRHAYFDYRFAAGTVPPSVVRRTRHSAQNLLDRALPRGLRPGITLVLRPRTNGH